MPYSQMLPSPKRQPLKGIVVTFRSPSSHIDPRAHATAAVRGALRRVLLLLCVVLMFGAPAAHAAAFDGRAATATASNYPASPRYADVNAVTFTVTGSSATPMGSVMYIVDTGTAQTAPLAGGIARANLGMLTPGTHSVSYTYAGDGAYSASATQTLAITVADLPFALTGARRLVAGGVDFGYYSAFDKAGNLYTTETNNNLITKYDTSGNLTTVPSSGLTSPRGIVFDLSGNFYVADAGNNRILKFTLNGSPFTQSVVNITGLSNPTTLAFNPTATVLYIADRNNNRIVTYNLATQVLTPIVTNGNLASLAVDAAGNLYYSQFGSYQPGFVYKLDTQGNTTDLFYPGSSPSGLAVDAAGNLYISDNSTNNLSRYDSQGHFVQVGSINSASIAIDTRGRLFFPEGSALYEFVPGLSAEFGNISAGYLFNYGSTPIAYLSYQLPYNTSISTITIPTANTGFRSLGPNCNGSGNSYCDATFDFEPIYPGRGTGYAHVTLNNGVTADTLLYGNGYNPELAFSPGVQSTQTPGLTTPAGVTLDTLRVPYISDSAANKVYKVPASGSAVEVPFTGLNKPTQLAVDGAFSVFVLDSGNNRIVKVDSAGNQTVPFLLSRQSALTSLSAFFVDGAGTLFLSGTSGSAAAIYSLDLGGKYAAVESGITLPTALLVDGFGNIFSGEGSTGILREVDTLGNNTILTSSLPGISSLTEEPSGVFDVTQTGVNTVTSVGLDGTLNIVPITGLTLPIATAVSPNADLYVLDASTLKLTDIVRSQPVPFVYGSVQVGSTKTTTQSLFNAGNRAVTITDALPGDANFVSGTANQCVPGTLAAGASCTFAFTFTPTQARDYDETGNIDTNTSGANFVFEDYPVRYTGTGTNAVATAAVSPATLAFDSVSLGTTSASQVVTLANTGGATLSVNAIALSGSSAVTQRSTTCGSTLAASASCTVTLVFTPTTRTASTATLTITDNSSTGTTQTVAITGTGVAPLLAVSPSTISFADTQSGGASASQSITATNSGNAVANISGITLSGADPTAFTVTNSCGNTLAASATCTFTVTFNPNAVRAFAATVNVASDDPATPATVRLTGNGITAGKFSIAPATQAFPLTTVANASAVQTSILSNGTAQAIYLSPGSLTDASDFTQSDNCSGLLAAGGTCTVSFTFAPKNASALTSTYAIHDLNNPSTPLTVVLSGSGTAALVPIATLTPASLVFAATPGSASAVQIATLSNTGNAPLTISSLALGGPNPALFTETNTCGATLASGATCAIAISFKPGDAGKFTATVTVTDNSGSTGTTTVTQTVALSGSATTAAAPVALLTPSSLTFAATAGSSSVVQNATLSNTGNAPLAIASIALGGTNSALFAETTTCGATLAAAASCGIAVTFNPSVEGTFAASLTVTDNSGSTSTTTTTQTAALAGTGTSAPVAQAVLTPGTANFGVFSVGASTPALTFMLNNPGTAPLSITSIALSGTNASAFSLESNSCGLSLAAGANCTISISLLTTVAGSDSAALTIIDTAGTQTSLLSATVSPVTTTTPPDFTLGATPATQSTYRGHGVAYTLQLTSVLASNAFTNAASLSVTGLPAGATVSFAQASVVPGVSSPATTVMTVNIPGLASEMKSPPSPRSAPLGLSLAALLLGFCLPRSKRRRALKLLSLVLLMVIAGSMVGCGTGTGFAVGTSTSNLIVTATSGATTHSTTVTLTIQ